MMSRLARAGIAGALALVLWAALGCTVRRTPLVINDLTEPARIEINYTDAEAAVTVIPPGERARLTVRPRAVREIEVTSAGVELLRADVAKIQETRSRLIHLHVDVEAWLIKTGGVWPLTRDELRGYDQKKGLRQPRRQRVPAP